MQWWINALIRDYDPGWISIYDDKIKGSVVGFAPYIFPMGATASIKMV